MNQHSEEDAVIVLHQIGRNRFFMGFENRKRADDYIDWCKENIGEKYTLLAIYEKVG